MTDANSPRMPLRKLATILGSVSPYCRKSGLANGHSQRRHRGRSRRSVLIICLSVISILARTPPTKEADKTKDHPLRWPFLTLIVRWRECEGVEPTYPARHEA